MPQTPHFRDMMFFNKKFTTIRWNYNSYEIAAFKFVMTVKSIKPFQKSFFGVQNSPGSATFVHEAMEVLGEIQSMEGVELKTKDILLLAPKDELGSLAIGDTIRLKIAKSGGCFKFEKV
ncbi:MAG: hypothetical protein LLG04_11295 [Parachlamydia sp.]|nr:hypothetical protein [Parachlamydia sp.]